MQRKLLILAFVSIILLGGLHQVGSLFYLYWDVVWFDTFMHLLGGFAITMLFFWFWYRFGYSSSRRNAFALALVFMLAVGIGWEVFEYYFKIANPVWDSYAVDTTHDLISDMIGSVVAGLIGTLKRFHD